MRRKREREGKKAKGRGGKGEKRKEGKECERRVGKERREAEARLNILCKGPRVPSDATAYTAPVSLADF